MSSSNDSSAGPARETASAEPTSPTEPRISAHDQAATSPFRPLADIMPLARAAEQEEESQDESEQAAAERVEGKALKARRKQRKTDKRRRGGDEDGKSVVQAKKKRRIDVESTSNDDEDEVDIMALAEEAALAVEDAKKAVARAGVLADKLIAAHSAMEARRHSAMEARREVKTRSTVERWREKVPVPR